MFFTLLPVLITHSFPPLAIQLLFTEIGMIVAYAMGLFPLWVFEFALIALLMAIFYKVFNWYRNQQGTMVFADGGQKDEGVISEPHVQKKKKEKKR